MYCSLHIVKICELHVTFSIQRGVYSWHPDIYAVVGAKKGGAMTLTTPDIAQQFHTSVQ